MQELRPSVWTQSSPPNITDNKSLPNLTKNSQNHSLPNKIDSQSNSLENISNNQLSSFLTEYKELIYSLIQ